jgi:endoglucanase
MKVKIILFFLLLAALNSRARSPVEQHGLLTVNQNSILDKKGEIVQLRGISMSWSIWRGQKYYNEEVLNWLIDDFKINVIRLAMAIEPAGGYLQHPEKQKYLIEKLIQQSVKRGIYVVIDWHDHNANNHVEHSKTFFAAMAKKYKNIPNVIYEIWNEPERQSLAVVKCYAATIIPEIRKYDKENLIIVGSPHWDQDIDLMATSPLTGFQNIAYSFHFYASEPSHQEKLMARANKAIKLGLPIFITEWGVGEANGDGIFDKAKTENWLNWMEENKLSWINWNVTDKVETTALLKPNASVKGNWKETDLTDAGFYIRKVLRALNK